MTAEDKRTLLKLNRETFAAEEHDPEGGWVDVLHRSLSDDFRLRRAIGETEDRERMITRLSRTEPKHREIEGEEVAVLGDVALVCCRVRLGEALFGNTKLFERTADGWRCVYWRVSRKLDQR